MPDEEQKPDQPVPAEPTGPPPDPNSTPFESPAFEKVERGIRGPWEKESDDD
jgi:hypothetical protein